MKKIVLFVLLVMYMSIGVCCSQEMGHGDLAAPSNWALEDISCAENMGVIDGFKEPWTNAITREQFCILSYNLLNFDLIPDWEYDEPFSDTDSDKIAGLYNLKIISGRGNDVFDPNGKITREEAAVILYNMSNLMGLDTDSIVSTLVAYIDDETISDWAKKSVYNMRKIDVMSGTDVGFMPKDNITVEQTISTLVRLHDIVFTDAVYDEGFADKLSSLIPDSTNYVISPFSVKVALMMAANGADGETKQEICDTLDIYDLDIENERIKELLKWYNQSELLKIDVSNSIWINEDKTDQKFSKKYEKKVEDIFDAKADSVTNADAATKINDWVKDKTQGKIPEIINEENEDFWAMLINAVYFKGRWYDEFSKELTKKDVFKSRNGVEHEIDFMNKTGWMSYGKKGGVEIVELPYLTREDVFDENGNYVDTNRIENIGISMYLVMSEEKVNPEMAINTISTESKYLELSVPKFRIEYSQNLADAVKELGINKAFTPDIAEFTGMFTKSNMWITSLMHKTYISVDEEGTEAAAVTAAGMAGNALPPEPVLLKFNKPFYFVIRDNVNDETLFIGSYAFANN